MTWRLFPFTERLLQYELLDQEEIQLDNMEELPVTAPHLSLPIMQSVEG